MSTIEQAYRIKAPLERVWQALVDPEIIRRWSGTKAVMDDQVGTEFSLWDGDLTGKNIEVKPLEKLIQEWRYRGWPTASVVTFALEAEGEDTVVSLLHESVPKQSATSIAAGWKDYYLGAIKELLEADPHRSIPSDSRHRSRD